MLINWFTVIAQIFNFLILVFLLKHFLYKPILNAIDAREKIIEDKLAAAETDMKTAQKEQKEFKEKNQEFELQRAELFKKAEEEAKELRVGLLDAARKDAEDLQTRWEKARINNEQILNQAVRLRTEQEIFAIVRKMLSELSDTSLEENIIDVFIRKFDEFSEVDKAQLKSVAEANPKSIFVRTMFEVSPKQKSLLVNNIKEKLTVNAEVSFETAPELISGIELVINDQKISWNISDYLASLEKNMKEFLNKQNRIPLKDEKASE